MLVFYLKVHAKVVKTRHANQQEKENEDDAVQEDDDENVEDEMYKLASTSASRIYSQASGQLLPRSILFDKANESEVIENLGDIDDEQIYSIS